MNTLLKSELKYFIILIRFITILPMIFIVFALLNTNFFDKNDFLYKSFWSILVGLGVYFFVFIIWIIRYKETRDRLHLVLPITLFNLGVNRWILGVSPFLLTWICLEVLQIFVMENYLEHIDAVIAQLGLLFIFIVIFDIVLNFHFGSIKNKFWNPIIVAAILVIVSIIVVYSVTYSIIPPFFRGGGELYFMTWGLLLSFLDIYAFTKRESFTG